MVLCGIAAAAAVLLRLAWRKKLSENQKKMLLILTVMAGFGVAAGMSGERGGQGEHSLPRNAAGEGSYEEQLQLDAGTLLEKYEYDITVPEQVLTPEEEQRMLDLAKKEIDREFLGENTSMDNVCKKVVIRESYQDGFVDAAWYFDNPDVVNYEGEIIAGDLPEQGTLIQASAELTCGDSGCSYEFPFLVKPLALDEREQLLKEIGEYLSAQETERGEDSVALPETLHGQKLQWKRKKEYLPEKLLLLGIAAAGAIPLAGTSKRQEMQKKRKEQLLMEYPDMISKLVLLMGAGMTLFGAWKKIALEYEAKRQDNAVLERISCEEMLCTCHEVEGGIGEGRAYERFGERCGVPCYRKLGNTLSQNLQKGNKGLLDLLEAEVEEAFEERKSIAKKYGEKAGTKLLVPMIMMLGMVMVLLLVPALLSFQL